MPSNRTWPASAGISPAMMLIRVLFPQPVRPEYRDQLAPRNVEIELVVDHCVIEPFAQPADGDVRPPVSDVWRMRHLLAGLPRAWGVLHRGHHCSLSGSATILAGARLMPSPSQSGRNKGLPASFPLHHPFAVLIELDPGRNYVALPRGAVFDLLGPSGWSTLL